MLQFDKKRKRYVKNKKVNAIINKMYQSINTNGTLLSPSSPLAMATPKTVIVDDDAAVGQDEQAKDEEIQTIVKHKVIKFTQPLQHPNYVTINTRAKTTLKSPQQKQQKPEALEIQHLLYLNEETQKDKKFEFNLDRDSLPSDEDENLNSLKYKTQILRKQEDKTNTLKLSQIQEFVSITDQLLQHDDNTGGVLDVDETNLKLTNSRINELIQSFQACEQGKQIREKMNDKYQVKKEAYDLMIKCFSRIINQNKKAQNKDNDVKNHLLKQMISYGRHDYQFKISIEESEPQTREFISQVMADIQQQFSIQQQKTLRTKFQNCTSKLANLTFQYKFGRSKQNLFNGFTQNKKSLLMRQNNIYFSLKKSKAPLTKNKTCKFRIPNYQNAVIVKLKQFVMKHFMSVKSSKLITLKDKLFDAEDKMLSKHTWDGYFSSKFMQLVNQLEILFPKKQNIGKKYMDIGKNMFLNDFLYEVLGEALSCQYKVIIREYFRLVDQDGIQDKKLVNLMTKINAERLDLDALFMPNIEKAVFFESAKQQHQLKVQQSTFENEKRNAMRQYQQIASKNSEKNVRPPFMFFQPKIIFLSQELISLQVGSAFQTYLFDIKDIPGKRVKQIVIDQCNLSDEVFACILNGIIAQCVQGSEGIRIQYLQSIIYSNNQIGYKSMLALQKLIPRVSELILNNIDFIGHRTEEEDISKHDIIQKILSSVDKDSSKIMKFKISNIQLNSVGQTLVKNICNIVTISKNMIFLDLSWAKLLPQDLAKIACVLTYRFEALRNLNLSYNQLQFTSSKPKDRGVFYSTIFMENVTTFLKEAKFMNHINFSGMNLQKAQILTLLNLFKECKFMLGVHLSDNGITGQDDFTETITNFGIQYRDIPVQKLRNETILESAPIGDKTNYYKNFLSQHFTINKSLNKGIGKGEKQFLQQQKDHILLGKETKILNKYKQINKIQVNYGVGRSEDNNVDNLVITRKINHPELVFNQIHRPHGDPERFFKVNAASQWQLSSQNECYVCQKYHYTMIFYQRSSNPDDNQGLVQIKDKDFLKKQKLDFDKNIKLYKSGQAPLISGTVMNKGHGTSEFSRKLKMIRAEIFSLLQISQNEDFIQNSLEQTPIIQNGIIKYLQLESKQLFEWMLKNKLKGWEKLFRDKCLKNELMDIKTVNIPSLKLSEDKGMEVHVYAGFLKPGYHQFMIYDPLLEKAYLKDFIVNLNLREDLYPEYPTIQGMISKQRIRNVFKVFQEDDHNYKQSVIKADREATRNFSLVHFAKNKLDMDKVYQFLYDKFEGFKTFYVFLQLQCETNFPKINFETLYLHIEQQNRESSMALFDKQKVSRAQIELGFIQATKRDVMKGLKGTISRCQLIESILRVCSSWILEKYGYYQMLSDHIEQFFMIYIYPYTYDSNLYDHRNMIRESPFLNKLLYDNNNGLRLIYEKYKDSEYNLFCLESVYIVFGCIQNNEDFDITQTQLKECFLMSKQTIIDENTCIHHYKFLHFVEYLELICRIALVGVSEKDLIEYQVQLLLEIVYEYQYNEKAMNVVDYPLVPVDENFRHDIE